MSSTLRPVRFFFVDDPLFAGFATGSTWNGFANVQITPAVRDEIIAAFGPHDETAQELARLPITADGLIDLSNAFAAEIDEAATAVAALGGALSAVLAAGS